MDLGIISVSSSLIKQFIWKGNVVEHCPSFINAVSIAKTHKFTTLPMLCGSYFETGCIGSCANGERIDDLPRKKLTKNQERENKLNELKGLSPAHVGEKGINQIRIDERILVFKQRANEYGLILNEKNTQVTIIKRHPELINCYMKIIMDIFPAIIVIDNRTTLFALDTKLTKGIDYVWEPNKVKSDMDHTQMKMYHEMIHDIDFDLNPKLRSVINENVLSLIKEGKYHCAYWVWDYKEDDKIIERIIPYLWDATRKAELYEDIRKTYNFVEHYKQHGWKTNPSYERCNKCPKTKEECPDKTIIQII